MCRLILSPILLVVLVGAVVSGNERTKVANDLHAVVREVMQKKNHFAVNIVLPRQVNQARRIIPQLRMHKEDNSCHHILTRDKNAKNGGYIIYPKSFPHGLRVFCDMRHGDGWTLIQRQHIKPTKENPFENKKWEDYVNGFGNDHTQFWLGLEALHQMTLAGNHVQLRIDFIGMDDVTGFSVFEEFSVGDNTTNYKLHLAKLTEGDNAGLFTRQSGVGFSTVDRKNDLTSGMSCAKKYQGGFWYTNCGDTKFNQGKDYSNYDIKYGSEQLLMTEMKIKNFN